MQENKMGVMPINKLLITMSLPIMISMLIQALYNIVDSMFVAQINENALTAVSLAFPMQNLMIAVSVGTGVGLNAILSRSLGQKNKHKANLTAENGIFLAVLSSIVFMIIGFFGTRFFFESQHVNAQITEYGIEYLTICTVFSFGVFLQIAFERILQATGRTFYTMITQSIGAIVNIIMDPILIFGLFGFPKLGVVGAAYATIIGQIFAAILSFIINKRLNHDVDLKLKEFKPNKEIILEIYKIGIPSIIMMSITSVMTYGMNQILLAFKNTAAAFFGVYIKLQSFVFMPIFGMNNGSVSIVSYNYGAGRKDRVMKTLKLALIYATILMVINVIVFQLFPSELLSIFKASDTMLEIGVPGLRIISIHFVIAGLCIVLSSFFQALGHGVASLISSIARQLVALLPVAYFMSLTGDINKVWLAYPISELVCLMLSTYFLKRIYTEQIACLPDHE